MELLENVKAYLSITSDDEDLNKNISLKIEAIKHYLQSGGAIIDDNNITEKVASCIAMGVNDLLNSKAGETKLSPAFNIFAKQICIGGRKCDL